MKKEAELVPLIDNGVSLSSISEMLRTIFGTSK
jgi:hypothetical protein